MKTGDRMVRGAKLVPEDQASVLGMYVHRYTGDHRPKWVELWGGSTPKPPLQFKSDREWLAHSWFVVRKDGRLDRRVKSCLSEPTWPENPELKTRLEVVGRV